MNSSRRDFHRIGSFLLGGAVSVGLAIPGVAFLLDPIRRKSGKVITQELTRLSALTVGEPKSFAIIAERRDAWVQYPKEPVGLVWLVRQPEGSGAAVVAYTAECPHIGCQIGLTDAIGPSSTFKERRKTRSPRAPWTLSTWS
jgi:menaquinol-cytochrome c reductase iron-sulfur subunit